MKNKELLVTIVVMTLNVSMLLSQTLDEMRPKQRDALLISIAKEVIMKFAPDYYREYQPPIISRGVYPYTDVDKGKNQGRITYSVIIHYDPAQETLAMDYAVAVGIWSDTKEPHGMAFGNGWSRSISDNWRTDTSIKPAIYRELEIFPDYDLNNPDPNQEPKNKDELMRHGYERKMVGGREQWEKVRPDVPPAAAQRVIRQAKEKMKKKETKKR